MLVVALASRPSFFKSIHLWIWAPARAEPVIGRAFARPVGLAGTTWNLGLRRRIDRALPASQLPLAQENIKSRADDDGRAQDRCRLRHIAEHEIAEHHRPDDHRILIRHHDA